MQQRHVTNCHVTRKGSWEMTALAFPWEYVDEEVPSLVVTLWGVYAPLDSPKCVKIQAGQ